MFHYRPRFWYDGNPWNETCVRRGEVVTAVVDLKEILQSAEEAIAVIEDEDRKRIAFERLLDHLLKNVEGGQAAAGGGPELLSDPERATADGAFAEDYQRLDAIAHYFGIEPEQVTDIFDVSEEEPRLKLSSGQLSGPKANGTREIALLMTGARTALGYETNTEIIRVIADDYGKLHSSHFMSTLAGMTDLSLLGKRRSSNRILRMKVRGAEEAARLAQRLVGE